MAYRQFSVLLAVRLLIVGVTMALLIWFILKPGFAGATFIMAAIFLGTVAELWRHVYRTNKELTRFLNAARYADFSQRFEFEDIGAGFGPLGNAFSDILERFRSKRADQEADLKHLRALVEHIPVPLLTVHNDDTITLQNNAARRLFGAAHVTRLNDLRQFGASFGESVANAVPGRRELVTFAVEDIEYQLTLATTEIVTAGELDRLISLQDIQSELDVTQAQAWQDLVRVLTHEIMNSITPVTSLAKTATELVEDVRDKNERDEPIASDLDDLHSAIGTVARRSDSLVQFVDSYRQLTRLAPAEKKRIAVTELFDAVSRLSAAEWPDGKVVFSITVTPPGLDVYADRDLVEPVLLNLLRNAVQATANVAQPNIQIGGRMNRRGNVVLEVSDNGPGVPIDMASKIFVPFFTTKKEGSGVGLALARQIMIAHSGFVTLGKSESGGARFSLIF
jgi:nitrogen fixation/metabolism regulation signal transduction histidine kinase